MRESAIERTVGEFCKRSGITFQKQSGVHDRGKADRLLMRQGKAAFLELKATGGRPTALQERYLSQRRMDGFDAAWYDNAADAIKWIKQIFGV
jgi:hypothetical protein